jgi:hypothetical protein
VIIHGLLAHTTVPGLVCASAFGCGCLEDAQSRLPRLPEVISYNGCRSPLNSEVTRIAQSGQKLRPLMAGQQGIWQAQQLDPGSPIYNPIRLAVRPGMPLGELARQVSAQVRQGLRHQRYRSRTPTAICDWWAVKASAV